MSKIKYTVTVVEYFFVSFGEVKYVNCLIVLLSLYNKIQILTVVYNMFYKIVFIDGFVFNFINLLSSLRGFIGFKHCFYILDKFITKLILKWYSFGSVI